MLETHRPHSFNICYVLISLLVLSPNGLGIEEGGGGGGWTKRNVTMIDGFSRPLALILFPSTQMPGGETLMLTGRAGPVGECRGSHSFLPATGSSSCSHGSSVGTVAKLLPHQVKRLTPCWTDHLFSHFHTLLIFKELEGWSSSPGLWFVSSVSIAAILWAFFAKLNRYLKNVYKLSYNLQLFPMNGVNRIRHNYVCFSLFVFEIYF